MLTSTSTSDVPRRPFSCGAFTAWDDESGLHKAAIGMREGWAWHSSPRGRMGVVPSCFLAIAGLCLFLLYNLFTELVLPCAFPWVWARVNRCRSDNIPHPWQQCRSTTLQHAPRHNIAVATALDNFMSAELRERTIENKRRYSDYWGHHLFAPNVEEVRIFAEGFPTAWAKLRVAEEALKIHDYVFMVDGDAVIMRNDIDLSLAIDQMEAAGASLLISSDFNSLNSGVFIFKRSNWTMAFLAEARIARPMLAAKTSNIPLKYENRAFFYLTGMWPECGGMRRPDGLFAPKYHETERFRDGTYVVDRCLINRHPIRAAEWWKFLDSGAGYDDISDAFVVHVPGGTPQSKARAMSTLLVQTESALSGTTTREKTKQGSPA